MGALGDLPSVASTFLRGEAHVSEQRIDQGKFLSDIRSGMDERRLMVEYNLDRSQLQRLFRELMIAGHLHESELFECLTLTDSQVFKALGDAGGSNEEPAAAGGTAGSCAQPRGDDQPEVHPSGTVGGSGSSRKRIRVRLPVTCRDRPGVEGLVRDLSLRELRVASPRLDFCGRGESKTLAIGANTLGCPEPIIVQAQCLWTRRKGKRRRYFVAGFEITHVSDECLRKIEDVLERLDKKYRSMEKVKSRGRSRADASGGSSGGSGTTTSEFDPTGEYVVPSNGLPVPRPNARGDESAPSPLDAGSTIRSRRGVPESERRRWPRYRLASPVSVFEAGDPENTGVVENLTHRGMGVSGMRAAPKETKTFVLDLDEQGRIARISFEAICCWSAGTFDGRARQGFEITRIAEGNLTALREFIEELRATRESGPRSLPPE
jgi:hypothetical protein